MKKCVMCDKEYENKRSDVCSLKCSSKRSRQNIKSLLIRNCLICGTEFIAKRVDKKCCSQNCSSRLNYHKKSGNTKYKELKTCTNCRVEKSLTSFYHIHKTYFAFCKLCYDNHNEDKYLIAKLKIDNFVDVEKFVNKIKRQKYMASDADIFTLIDLFDLLYPDDLTTYEVPLETLNYYFYKMALWYKKKKETIYKNL